MSGVGWNCSANVCTRSDALSNGDLAATPAVHDLTGDGMVNVLDVQIEMNAALGLGCAAR
jgi:hypothetical protein